MKNTKAKTILTIVLLLVLICLIFNAIKMVIFLFVERTFFSDSMASMFIMLLLSICAIIIRKKLKLEFSIFPERFSLAYIIFTVVAAAIFIATPSNFQGGIKAISLLFYSSVVTPFYEELIFRGYAWNKLNTVFEKEWQTYIATTILFALWHLGYTADIAFRVQDGLANIMLWKVVTGFCFGVVLGGLRLKTKNCYSTMLLHGLMNIFGR